MPQMSHHALLPKIHSHLVFLCCSLSDQVKFNAAVILYVHPSLHHLFFLSYSIFRPLWIYFKSNGLFSLAGFKLGLHLQSSVKVWRSRLRLLGRNGEAVFVAFLVSSLCPCLFQYFPFSHLYPALSYFHSTHSTFAISLLIHCEFGNYQLCLSTASTFLFLPCFPFILPSLVFSPPLFHHSLQSFLNS